jgi:hypothetical protein
MEMNWSRWFRCESSFELLLVPNQPGVFALAEEIVQPAGPHSRRMLAVFEVNEAEDLARAMSRLFAVGSPWRERLAQAGCYVRYAVAPSIADRRAATAALKNWLSAQREVASQIFDQRPSVATEQKPLIESETGERRRAPHEGEVPILTGRDAEAAGCCAALEGAGEMRSERSAARAQHEGEAAERCGAFEIKETELKTIAERAVDRVTLGMKTAKAATAGY